MWNIQQLTPYFKLFYLFGLYPSEVVKPKIYHFHWIKQYLPPLILFSFIIATNHSIFITHADYNHFREIDKIMFKFYGVCYSASISIGLCQNILNLKSSLHFSKKINDLFVSMEQTLQINSSRKQFIRNFQLKTAIIFLATMIAVICKKILKSAVWLETVDTLLSIAAIYKSILAMFILMFIEIIHYTLLKINEKMNNLEFNPRVYLIVPHERSTMQTLYHLKVLHFELWNFKNTFHQCFGWSLVVFLLESFAYMTILMHLTVVSKAHFYIIRKYTKFIVNQYF